MHLSQGFNMHNQLTLLELIINTVKAKSGISKLKINLLSL